LDREDHSDMDEPSHSDELDDFIKKDSIQAALLKLDERYRTVFLCIFMEGLNTKETAYALNLPQGTILTRIHRAKKMMKSHLKAYESEYSKKTVKPHKIKLVSGGEDD
jgi:RNA polymerase sigma factor (sigma-70 family)